MEKGFQHFFFLPTMFLPSKDWKFLFWITINERYANTFNSERDNFWCKESSLYHATLSKKKKSKKLWEKEKISGHQHFLLFPQCFLPSHYQHFLLFPRFLPSPKQISAFQSGLFSFLPLLTINPFPNAPSWDRPKFKQAADDNWNLAIKGLLDTGCIENIVEKGEIAHFE